MLELTKKAAVVEIASSKAVVTALALVLNVLDTFALVAVNETVAPVPCAPKPKSVDASEVTAGKVITVSVATGIPVAAAVTYKVFSLVTKKAKLARPSATTAA
jgi:hypothetical protein